jgi:cbb3-type cytochrome oxidase maturation protein
MSSMYMLILIALAVGIAAWLLFPWAVKSGQFDDTERPKYRMLEDDDEEPRDKNKDKKTGKGENKKE